MMSVSQERLGELLGVTFQQVQKYERGANRIGSSRLFAIGKILDTPISWFFDEIDESPSPSEPASGLFEARTGFLHQSLEHRDAAAKPAVDQRETLEFVRIFHRIRDPMIRQRLYDLAKALAALPDTRGSNR